MIGNKLFDDMSLIQFLTSKKQMERRRIVMLQFEQKTSNPERI